MVLKQLNLTPRKCLENIAMIGQTGSGKSTSLNRLLLALACGLVGLCLCTVKSDAALEYALLCRKARREDVKVFCIGQSRFNPLSFILSRNWGSPQVVAEFIEELDELQSRTSGAPEQGYWRINRRESATHSVGVCHLAYGNKMTFEDLFRFLSSVPASLEALATPAWLNSYCRNTFKIAAANAKDAANTRLLKAAHDALTIQNPMAGGKVVGATTGHLAGLIANFTRGALYDTTCGESDHTPLHDLNGGITIFADAASAGQGNQFLQLLYARCLTREALARQVTADTPFTYLVRDEYSELCAPKADAQALTQGRSQHFGQIICVQGVSTLLNAMSDGHKAKYQANTILGNCITKLFLSNTDPETGELFEKLCGKNRQYMLGGSQSAASPQRDDSDFLGVGQPFQTSFNQQVLPRKLASALTTLRTGGPTNDFLVDFYLHQSGTRFSNGLPFKKVTLRQDV